MHPEKKPSTFVRLYFQEVLFQSLSLSLYLNCIGQILHNWIEYENSKDIEALRAAVSAMEKRRLQTLQAAQNLKKELSKTKKWVEEERKNVRKANKANLN